jgi:hypothetical protein
LLSTLDDHADQRALDAVFKLADTEGRILLLPELQ